MQNISCKHHVREFTDLSTTNTTTGCNLNLLGIHPGGQYTSSDLMMSGKPVNFPELDSIVLPAIGCPYSPPCSILLHPPPMRRHPGKYG